MRHKSFVITRIEAQQNLIQSLKKSMESRMISQEEAFRMLDNINKNLELVVERLGLESDE